MANPDRCICCICGEELDERGECPECDVTYDTSAPAWDDPREED